MHLLVLLVFVQIIVFFVCYEVVGMNKITLVKWNISAVIASLVLTQIAVIAHNIQIGNISLLYRHRPFGPLMFVLSFIVVIALMIGLSWFAFVCFSQPESVQWK